MTQHHETARFPRSERCSDRELGQTDAGTERGDESVARAEEIAARDARVKSVGEI